MLAFIPGGVDSHGLKLGDSETPCKLLFKHGCLSSVSSNSQSSVSVNPPGSREPRGLVSLVNDLTSQSDQACDETLLLSSQLLRFDFVLVDVGGLLHLHLLLGLDLVDDLIEQVFGVIDATRVFCSSHQFVPVGLHVDQACEKIEELSARLVLNRAEVFGEDS